MPRWITRRRFFSAVAIGGVGLAGGALYTRAFEPGWLHLHRVAVPRRETAGPSRPVVRLLHLSDLHYSDVVPLAFIIQAIELGLAERPDAIVLTGDYFTNTLPEVSAFAAALRRLSAAAPTFAVLGNHDGGPWTQRAGGYATTREAVALLEAAQIDVLVNRATTLELRGRRLEITGVGDPWSEHCDPRKTFAGPPPPRDASRVLLCHNPDAKHLLQPSPWELLLCGHTHGGQLRLPLLGTPFAPVQDRRYVEGLHRWDDRWLYITRGVGNLHGLRFNCRPQVSVLDLA